MEANRRKDREDLQGINMKICLIDPIGVTKGLNAGLGYLASSLINEGHIVKVIDLNNNGDNTKNRINDIKNYDIIGVSVKSFTTQSTYEISKLLRGKKLICGGPHITLDGYNFLQENPNFSIGVIGEGEQTLGELTNAIENNMSLQDIKGILYRDKNELIVNPRRDFIHDLDSLPYPNYEVFDSFSGTIANYPLVTSRGCPYACIYCCVGKVSGKKWRSRDPKEIIKELEFAKVKYNSKKFGILDDTFTQDVKRAKKICELLIDHSINMSWSCGNGIRADKLDEELVALMKDSGCSLISLGIESGDSSVFNNIKKGVKLEDIEHAINLSKKYKIKVIGSFIVGLPGDNLQKTKSSIKYAKKLELDEALWNLFVPYPGIEAWQWVNENAKILRDWKEGFHFGTSLNPVFETKDFSETDRIHACKLANIKCKGYLAFFDAEKSFLPNALNIIILILKYDAKNLPSHILYALKNIKRIYDRVNL